MFTRVVRWLGGGALAVPRAVWGLVAAAWIAGIWRLSEIKGAGIPGTFAWSWIGNSAHALLYGLLALWLAFALPRRPGVTARGWADLRPAFIAAILVVVAVYGAVDEWHQSWVAGRTVSLADWLTDVTGASVVLWVARGAAGEDVNVGRRLAIGLGLCMAASLVATVFAGVL